MAERKRERVIHWRGTRDGVCARKDRRADSVLEGETADGAKIWATGEAVDLANVTCAVCRRAAERRAA